MDSTTSPNKRSVVKRYNKFIVDFLTKHGHLELVDLWCETENQELFNKLRFVQENENKRPASSFFLFCKQRRPELQKEKPFYPTTRIVSILGKEWQQHKTDNDEIYITFKELAKRNLFDYFHAKELYTKYPHFSDDDIKQLLSRMYFEM